MVDQITTPGRNVVDFLSYQKGRMAGRPNAPARGCRHCGAALLEGEAEDDCSSAGIGMMAPPRRFYAE